MTDELINDNDDLPVESELDSLKARADLMGIKYHPSIGVDSLKAKLSEASEPEKEEGVIEPQTVPEATEGETPAQLKIRQKKEANRLIRCRITCMNPNKKDWEGEIFTCGNAVVGTLKKYVPYDTEWHVPSIILGMIEARQCQVFQTVTEKGVKVKRGKLVKEFAVAILPNLTPEELKDLAQRQAMANGTSA